MKKRLLASLMSMCLIVGLLPTAALAAESDTTEEVPQAVVCEVTPGCTLEAGHEGDCVVAPAEGNSSEQENDPDAQPGDEDGSEVCGNLEGCDGDTHDPECPLYVAPVAPTEEPEEQTVPVELVEENGIVEPVPVAENGKISGNCGVSGSESSVTWALTVNNGDASNPTYTLTISGSGAMADYNVDTGNQSANGYYKVTNSPWLNYADKITKIDLSTDITKIGKGAFNSCAITELPWSGKETQYSTLTEIGQFAFAGCIALTEVTFVPSVTTYGNYAFEGCTNLTSIDWTNYLPSAENSDKLSVSGVLVATGLFAECSSLTSDFALPEQIIGIDRAAFRNTGYTAIDFTTDAPGVKVIEEQAFSGSKLASITLPSSDTHPDTKFGVGAFSGTEVTTISIPYYSQSGNANVSEQMFKDCDSLSSVVLGDGITSIGKNAFSGTAVSAINWPASLTTIGDYAFNGAKFDSLDIPSNITTIGGQAFYKNTALKSVVIRAGSVSIGYAAFAQCENLETIDLSKVTSLTATSLGANSGSLFMSIKDGSVLYVNNASLISGADGRWYSIDKTARIVVGDATVDTTKTGFDAVTKAGYTAQWYRNSQFTGDSATEISKTENSNRSYPTYYAKWTLAVPTVTVSADKTYISSGETSTLTATTQHGLAGVTYEYQWYTDSPGSGTKIDGATSQSYSVSSLSQASTYYCEVVAVNGADKSEAGKSKAVTITPANAKGSVTITDNKTSAIYGDEPFTFSYTASGEATVTSSNPSVAAVSNNNGTVTVAIAGAGTAEISVDFEGSTEYSTASANFTLTVAQATLTITADNKFIYVGDALPTYTYTVSGRVGDDRLTTDPTVTCAGADANKAGTYTITATGADAGNNYTINYVDGTLTVRTPSSGGGSSSSGNVSGSGDNVSVTASSGSVTTAQMEKAVDRADRGETITIEASSRSSVSLPSSGLQDAADNNNDVTVELKNGEVTLSPEALSAVAEQAGTTVTLTVDPVDTDELNSRQQAAVGDAPVFDLTLKSGGKMITDFDGGLVTVAIPYELPDGQDPAGVVVWFMDDNGNITACETMYDLRTETVIFTTRHFSKYVIGHVEPMDFTDVAEGAYYYDAVAWAVQNGITNGTSATTFGPDVSCTRAQMVTFLWRAAGSPEPATANNPFTDVQAGSYYYDAVLWAVEQGITSGTSATTFAPDSTVTRAQTVTFLWRQAGAPVVNYAMSFTDVDAKAYYGEAVRWAVSEGVTSGTSATTFSPDVDCTRAQIVTFMFRDMAD